MNNSAERFHSNLLRYMAGYLDGDGTVRIDRGQVLLRIFSIDPSPLYAFKRHFGGIIHVQYRGSHRAIFQWTRYQGLKHYELLAALSEMVVLKRPQMKLALAHCRRVQDVSEEMMGTLNTICHWFPVYVRGNDLIPYLAGFFDAEGSINTPKRGKSVRVSVDAASTSQWILRIFQRNFGGSLLSVKRKFPHVRQGYRWIVNYRKAYPLLTAVLPHLIVKRKQAELVLRLQSLVRPRQSMSEPDRLAIAEIAESVKAAKHQLYVSELKAA